MKRPHKTAPPGENTRLRAGNVRFTARLALTSSGRTHLARLEDFGSEHTYDQRQVRRYSDMGMRRLATMIATNWSTSSVPTLDVTVTPASDKAAQVIAKCITGA